MSIEEIEAAISQLSPDDLAQLAAWFLMFQAGARGRRVDADVKGGKLDQLALQAKEEAHVTSVEAGEGLPGTPLKASDPRPS
jgi:hypothetical protein